MIKYLFSFKFAEATKHRHKCSGYFMLWDDTSLAQTEISPQLLDGFTVEIDVRMLMLALC